MSGHALEVLEFERVLGRVAQRASSDLGRERVRTLRPRIVRDEIARELARVSATTRFLEGHPDWALGAVPDVRETLRRLAVEGAVLDPGELYRVAEVLSTSRSLRLELLSSEGRFPELATVADDLVDLPKTEEAIRRSIDA